MARDNKTEQATPRRRQKAREKGQVVRSRELVASLATMSALLLLTQLGSFPGDWRALLRASFEVASGSARFSPTPVLMALRGVASYLPPPRWPRRGRD